MDGAGNTHDVVARLAKERVDEVARAEGAGHERRDHLATVGLYTGVVTDVGEDVRVPLRNEGEPAPRQMYSARLERIGTHSQKLLWAGKSSSVCNFEAHELTPVRETRSAYGGTQKTIALVQVGFLAALAVLTAETNTLLQSSADERFRCVPVTAFCTHMSASIMHGSTEHRPLAM